MNKKLLPKTRFLEFVNEKEWEKKELSKLGKLINGLTYSPKDVREKGLLVLRSSNIQNGQIDLKDCVFVDPNVKGVNLTEPNDILVCVRNGSKALIGKNALIPKGLPLATHGAFMTIFRAKNPEFVFQLFQTDFYDKQVKADLGATINSINGKNFLKYEFPTPKNQKEQQKIADCLSSLDKVIIAYKQKLDLLKEHKKGMIQNLFPQEGETVPKYRFQEFVTDGDWQKMKIEEIAKISAGGTPESTNLEYWNGDIPWMNSGELNNKRIYSVSNYITAKGLKESSTKLIPPNCILIGLAGQGKTRGTAAINYIELCTNQSIGSIHPNKKVYDSEFLYQKIDSIYEKLRFLSAGDGGRGGLNLQIIKEIELLLPKMKEQQKIANCLSSLDEIISKQNNKIIHLKQHKKGLMQRLFPKIND
jgi:type I restriction enzyme S subunit